MSATPSPAQSLPKGDHCVPAPVPAAEIDASCRGPVLMLLVSAAVWVFISSVFGVIASLKMHAPNFLANCAPMTYGRVHPIAINTLIYGFGVQAGLAVLAWMLAHLGRVRLAGGVAIFGGGLLWNFGVTLGVIGILGGDSTGHQWLAFPSYASVMLFIGYLLMGIGALRTFHARRERSVSSPQLLAVAAVFWFPWIYATARILLVNHPVRGALQGLIDSWYMNNLKMVWFGFTGLAAIFYFISKLTERPLYSHYIGLFVFWTLGLFGSWGAVHPGSPLPTWIESLSAMGAVLTLVPVLAVAVNVRRTLANSCGKMKECRSLKFFCFGGWMFVLGGIAGALMFLTPVSQVVNFTWFITAQNQLMLYGFFAIAMFGAIYHIVPRLLATEFPSPKLVCFTFVLAALGIILYALPLGIGGIRQGLQLADTSKSFMDVLLSSLMFFRVSTLGDLLMLAAHLVLLLNLFGILSRAGKASAAAAWAANTSEVRA